MSTQNKKDCSWKRSRRVTARRSHTNATSNVQPKDGAAHRIDISIPFHCVRIPFAFGFFLGFLVFRFQSNRFMISVFIPTEAQWKHIAIRFPYCNRHLLAKIVALLVVAARSQESWMDFRFLFWYIRHIGFHYFWCGYSCSSPFITNGRSDFPSSTIVSFNLVTSKLALFYLIEMSGGTRSWSGYLDHVFPSYEPNCLLALYFRYTTPSNNCENWTRQHYSSNSPLSKPRKSRCNGNMY